MDVGLRTENPAVLTLLQWKRDIMKTIINEKMTNWFSGVIPHLAILGILATFKDGHHFKEGQLKKGLPIMGLFAAPLDYPCANSSGSIWGKRHQKMQPVTRLWLIPINSKPSYRAYLIDIALITKLVGFSQA